MSHCLETGRHAAEIRVIPPGDTQTEVWSPDAGSILPKNRNARTRPRPIRYRQQRDEQCAMLYPNGHRIGRIERAAWAA